MADMPDGLGEAGTALWSDVTSRFDLDAEDAALLRAAAQTVDLIEALRVTIEAQGVTVAGRVSPAVAEHRQQSRTLAALLHQLGIPGEVENRNPVRRRNLAPVA